MGCGTDFCDWEFTLDSRNPWRAFGYSSLGFWRDIQLEREIAGEASHLGPGQTDIHWASADAGPVRGAEGAPWESARALPFQRPVQLGRLGPGQWGGQMLGVT